MLARMLHIGKQPERNCTFYQPLVFNVTLKKPFFPELFARTMWLLSKTRREMKASIKEDYSKVFVNATFAGSIAKYYKCWKVLGLN